MTEVPPSANGHRLATELSETERKSLVLRATRGLPRKEGRATSSFVGPDNPTVGRQIDNLFSQYKSLAYNLPWDVLDYVELLAQWNPDYSQAVENIKMLANSGHTLYVDAGSELQRKKIKSFLEEKSRLIQETHGGVDGVIDKLMGQGATFGAMAGEWVLSDDLKDVIDFVDLSPKRIRYFWIEEEDRYAPFQKVSSEQAKEAKAKGQEVRGNHVRLNEITFRYHAFNAAPESPYGTPPFLAALTNIAIQRDMVHNMAQIVRKIGLLAVIDLAIERLDPLPNETDDQYAARAGAYLDQYVDVAEEMVRSGGIVHFDDVKASAWSIAGNAAGATNIHKQNEELVFSGLKSMPSVQGRCLDPQTRVVMADGSVKKLFDIEVGDLVQGFDEHTSISRRRWREAKVENVWTVEKSSVRLHLSDGRSILASEDHPFLMQKQNSGFDKTDRTTGSFEARRDAAVRAAEARWSGTRDEFVGTDWKRAGGIREGEWIKAIREPLAIDYASEDYMAGYVAGAGTGDGCWRVRSEGKYPYWQIAVQEDDSEILDRIGIFALRLGMPENWQERKIRKPVVLPLGSSFPGTKRMEVLKTCRSANVEFLNGLDVERETDDYKAGWLAGILDTDGNFHRKSRGRDQLRFCQNEGPAKDRIEQYLSDLGFVTSRSERWIEVLGDKIERWRLTASLQPVLDRKVCRLDGHTVRTFTPVQVVRIEGAGTQTLIDITTTTSTFVGDGLLTHNSYSTTETYAGVAYDIIIRNTFKFQRAVKRTIESGYWLMCQTAGLQPDNIRIVFNENRSLNRLQEAQSEKIEIANAYMLWLLGILDQVGASQRLGYAEPKKPMEDPPDALLSIASAHSVDEPPDSDFQVSPTTRATMEEVEDDDDARESERVEV